MIFLPFRRGSEHLHMDDNAADDEYENVLKSALCGGNGLYGRRSDLDVKLPRLQYGHRCQNIQQRPAKRCQR